jgi:hypothetical protein
MATYDSGTLYIGVQRELLISNMAKELVEFHAAALALPEESPNAAEK